MKKSDIEKRLKNELNNSVPSDFGAVWKQCGEKETVSVKERELQLASEGGTISESKSDKKDKFRKIVIWVLIAAILLTGFMWLPNLWKQIANPLDISEGYFIFDINPSLEVEYDKDGKIKSAKGLNKDGEVLLVDMDLIGKTYSEASDLIFDSCVKLGYFSAGRKNNAVLVSATRKDGKKDDKMTKAIKEELSSNFVENKILGVVITGVDNPAMNQEAEKYGIDGQKLALIKKYLALGGELDEEDYAEITIRELYEKISEEEKKDNEEFVEELNKEVEEAKNDLIEKMSEQVQDLIDELKTSIEELLDGKNDPLKEKYEKQLDLMEEYADQIEDSKKTGEVKVYVDGLLKELETIKKSETDPVLSNKLDTAITQIQTFYTNLENILLELEKEKQTAMETYEKRKNKYGKNTEVDIDIDIEEWQKEKEKEMSSSWYEIKMKWDEERDSDLDDD